MKLRIGRPRLPLDFYFFLEGRLIIMIRAEWDAVLILHCTIERMNANLTLNRLSMFFLQIP